jgi:hypothetical protein
MRSKAVAKAPIAKQDAPLTRPEAIRAMMETILHILSKDVGERRPRGSDATSDPTGANLSQPRCCVRP